MGRVWWIHHPRTRESECNPHRRTQASLGMWFQNTDSYSLWHSLRPFQWEMGRNQSSIAACSGLGSVSLDSNGAGSGLGKESRSHRSVRDRCCFLWSNEHVRPKRDPSGKTGEQTEMGGRTLRLKSRGKNVMRIIQDKWDRPRKITITSEWCFRCIQTHRNGITSHRVTPTDLSSLPSCPLLVKGHIHFLSYLPDFTFPFFCIFPLS